LHFWLPSKKLNQNHKAYHEVIYVTYASKLAGTLKSAFSLICYYQLGR
jgi:hypothetical protein